MSDICKQFLDFRYTPEILNLSSDEAFDEFLSDNGLASNSPQVVALANELLEMQEL